MIVNVSKVLEEISTSI